MDTRFQHAQLQGTDGRHHTSNFFGPVTYVERSDNLFMGANYGSVNQASHPARSDPANFLLSEAILDASHYRDLCTSPPNSICLPGTRKPVIHEMVSWMEDPTFAPAPTNDGLWHPGLRGGAVFTIASSTPNPLTLAKQHHIAWICGPEGCGKSAIAQTIAEEAERRGCLAASFFFCGDSDSRSKFNRVAITLASQLAAAVPATRHHIEAALRASPNLDGMSLETQFERLIYRPLQAAVGSGTLPAVKRRSPAGWLINYVKPFLIVIDGLDECSEREDVRSFIQHMIEYFEEGRNPRFPLRILITSRVEEHIQEALGTDHVTMLDLGNQEPKEDMGILLRHSFQTAARRSSVIRSYGEEWPLEHDIQSLIERSGGSFRSITTALSYILGLGASNADVLMPKERLDLALSTDRSMQVHK